MFLQEPRNEVTAKSEEFNGLCAAPVGDSTRFGSNVRSNWNRPQFPADNRVDHYVCKLEAARMRLLATGRLRMTGAEGLQAEMLV